jgi:hypothetical protein
MTSLYEIRKVPAQVASQSLVGAGKERPCEWGNYFDLLVEGKGRRLIRVLNFWAENLTHLTNTGVLEDGLVQIYDYGLWCIIQDPRIPQNYYYNRCCFTGSTLPTINIARSIYEILSDPSNEIELWTDPESYYEKRGSVYDRKTGLVRTTIIAKERKLKARWTIKQSESASFYAPFIS